MHLHTIKPHMLALLTALTATSGAALAGPGAMGGDFVGRELFRVERLAEDLALTDAQRGALDQLISQARDAARPLVRQMVEQRRAMRTLIDAETLDEAAVRAQVQQGSAAMAELAVLHARNMHALRGLLTPEQRAQLEDLRARRHRR